MAFANLAAVYVTSDGGAPKADSWLERFSEPWRGAWRTTGLDVTTVWHYYDRLTPVHLMCCTDVGLLRSADNGDTWNVPENDAGYDNFYEIAFATGDVLYAAVSTQHDIPHETQLALAPARGTGAVLTSDDRGASWTPTALAPGQGKPVVSIVAPDSELYASVWDAGIYRSDDRGESWTAVGAFPAGSSTFCGRIALGPDGTWYCVIAADLRNGFIDGDLYQLVGNNWTPVTAPGSKGPRLKDAVGAGVCPVDFCFGTPRTSGALYVCTQSVVGSGGGGGLYQFDAKNGWQPVPVPFPPAYGDGVQCFAPFVVERGGRPTLYVTGSHGVWYTEDADRQPGDQRWQELRVSPFAYSQRVELRRGGPSPRIGYVTTYGGGTWKVR
jgi:hypothetical protein